jgi:hypothetical protein
MMLRLATSLHYNLGKTGDNIDQINATTAPNLNRLNGNDYFTFTYFTLNLDLFSEDKTLTFTKLFEDIDDFDYDMFIDQDNDGVFDILDRCWETPFGIEVDTAGCPYDDDLDGVPNYLDKENSRAGAFVDKNGVELSDDELLAMLDNSDAVLRDEIELYIRDKSSYAAYYRNVSIEIPEKFTFLDQDQDSYISFDEMLDAIDMYFDFEAELSSDDIYELNDLFFSQ